MKGAVDPQVKKGIGFNVSGVMILADDTKFSGAAPLDAAKAFGGVSVQPPAVDPAARFGNPTSAAVSPPARNPWTCDICGTINGPSFTSCRTCGEAAF